MLVFVSYLVHTYSLGPIDAILKRLCVYLISISMFSFNQSYQDLINHLSLLFVNSPLILQKLKFYMSEICILKAYR